MHARRHLIVLAVLALLLSAGFLYASRHGSRPTLIVTAPQFTPSNAVSTTTINGSLFMEADYSVSDLSKGVFLEGVFIRKLQVTTTGCAVEYFLVMFPNGESEILGLGYGCTSPWTHTAIPEDWSKHGSPEVGIMGLQYMRKYRVLVSLNMNKTGWTMLAVGSSSDWVMAVMAPPNTSYSSSKLLYEAVYVGPGFNALPKPLPPTPSKIVVRGPGNTSTVILERGLCPWMRTRAWINPGYTYKYWVSLGAALKAPGTYNVTMIIHCTIPKKAYGGASSHEGFSGKLSFNLRLG